MSGLIGDFDALQELVVVGAIEQFDKLVGGPPSVGIVRTHEELGGAIKPRRATEIATLLICVRSRQEL
jgi:hypothetical protein